MATTGTYRNISAMALLLQAGLASGAPIEKEAAVQRTPEIRIIWNDPYELVQVGFEEIAEEVNSIFRRLDIEIGWVRMSTMNLQRSYRDILVLLLPENPSGSPLGEHVMGVVGPTSPPVVRVFFNEISSPLYQ